jgi:transcriptional regulator
MYQPAHFREPDETRALALVEAHSFGLLVAVDQTGAPEMAHLPFLVDRGARVLRTHVARANPLAKLAAAGRSMTAVFSGPHGYVSPRSYPQPRAQVPTWNYAVVHVAGVARVVDDAALRRLVDELAAVHEAGAAEPWRLEDADPELPARLLRGIVGIELPLERVDAKYKLSQNRSPEERAGVRRALAERRAPDDLALLALMPED